MYAILEHCTIQKNWYHDMLYVYLSRLHLRMDNKLSELYISNWSSDSESVEGDVSSSSSDSESNSSDS